ncbi:polysaccharide deacetylase family protein [Rhizobium oryzicola]|uniref:Chitooligosaccharide deacetylase n=1 Tax=Rhizobium oryzicola TaxID=1232668 RepID=A0ABT8SY71_9HYPH|nr:polysaccharide deacetylase family protein [Rhizobium oryzicola]MDO1582921.1 polysaccharide deacetylase family protein [Rhizobium oryzicola]
MSEQQFLATLEKAQRNGRIVSLWLRDDDAVEPTDALEMLLTLTATHAVPLTLAVIPEHTGQALAERLDRESHLTVTVHGWSHHNYAPSSEKKQELGLHRPLDQVLRELAAGRQKLAELHGTRFTPTLVPPWNRIAPTVVKQLQEIGYEALSVFGREKSGPLPLLNTHLDIMDWHGTRGGRDADVLFAELAGLISQPDPLKAIGVLTHHLVHDEKAWWFLERLFALTADHPACRWQRSETLLL